MSALPTPKPGRNKPSPGRKAQATVDLFYFGLGTVRVSGPASGQLYEFSRLDPVQTVDIRDAAAMLKTRLFRKIR